MNHPPRPRVGRPPTHTPEQLLDRLVQAAAELLDEQAADADFSVAQLAERAKVSKRTVYAAVSSKEELIGHIIARGAQVATTMLEPPVTSAAGARAVLASFLKEWVHFACSPQAVGIYVMAIRERSRFPAIGEAYYTSRTEHGLRQLAAWLKRMHGKRFLEAPDADLTAELLLAMAGSERQRVLALGMPAPLSGDLLEQRVAAILRLVFRAPPLDET